MIILSEKLLAKLLRISSLSNFPEKKFSIISTKHLSNKNFSRDNMIEGKNTERKKKITLSLTELKGTLSLTEGKLTNTCA
jgi:hypothetical protein